MATTTLTVIGERMPGTTTFTGVSAAVPVDATVGEFFRLPAGFGDLLVDTVECYISSLSGAYVAPAPINWGISAHIISADAATNQDWIGDEPALKVGVSGAQAAFSASIQQLRRTVHKQAELLLVEFPIIAGAGVTATVRVYYRGYRLRT